MKILKYHLHKNSTFIYILILTRTLECQYHMVTVVEQLERAVVLTNQCKKKSPFVPGLKVQWMGTMIMADIIH